MNDASGTMTIIDFETRSELDLRECGHYKYASDPSTRILLMALAVDDEPVQIFDLTTGPLPDDILSLLADPTNTIASWGSFDYVITNSLLMPLPLERYYDLSGHAQMLTYSAQLNTAAKQLDATELKDDAGTRLVRLFSAPQKTTGKDPGTFWADSTTHPREWSEFKSYAGNDVISARACEKVLNSICPFPASERVVYQDMQRQNDQGLPIDLLLTTNAITLLEDLHATVLAKFQAATGLSSFFQVAKIKAWCGAQGFNVETLKASMIREYLKNPAAIPESVIRYFELRQEQPKAAVAKYRSVLKYVSPDGGLRGMFRYHRAVTGRFAGVGPQVHNLPRPSRTLIEGMVGDDEDELLLTRVGEIVHHVRDGRLFPGIDSHEQLKSIARSVIQAPPGYRLCVMDFSGVENRYLGWMSGCESLLAVYRKGLSLYLEFALKYLGCKTMAEAKLLKQQAKVTVLGGGYGMGWRKFLEYAKGFGLQITEGEAQHLINAFRTAYPEICKAWDNIERAVTIAIKKRAIVTTMGHVVDATDQRAMSILLPSNRKIWYRHASLDVVNVENNDGIVGARRTIRYDSSVPGETRVATWGGKLIENVVQAGCRDLLTDAVRSCYEAGLTVLATIHDEIVCVSAEADAAQVKDTMRRIMRKCPQWCASLPMDAAGYDSEFYRK